MNSLNGVGQTSLMTAAMRAAETHRTDAQGRLFSDPFAEQLAGDEGKALLKKAIETVGDQPAIAIRTYYMDARIEKALAAGVRQIVILAAGMDSRAYRLKFPPGTTLFELDQSEVLAYKRNKLSAEKPRCTRVEVAVDLREEWQESLLNAGFARSTPTLWIIEGLLMYLNEEDVLSLFQKINHISLSGDLLLFDILTKTLIQSPFMKPQLDFLSSIGAPWKFGVNEPEQFMADLGWRAEGFQAGEVCPDRWPFPTAPRHIPNVPRGFFMEAWKLAAIR